MGSFTAETGMPDYCYEDEAVRDGKAVVAGIDEAGRGPWAGPVLAAAVVLDRAKIPRTLARRLDDSKKLSPEVREELFEKLRGLAAIGIGRAEVAEIDIFNILNATFIAMGRAVAALGLKPDLALVDGNRAPALACPVRCIVEGDGRSLSIAAASIAAKVTRDRIMRAHGIEFPGYGFENHMGYGTPEHRASLARLGPSPIHRRSFAPVLKMLNPARAGLPHLESESL